MMKTGSIIVKQDEYGKRTITWTSPVAEIARKFLGKDINAIHYSILPRVRSDRGYRRAVNKDWCWWRLYFAWDWISNLLRIQVSG